MKRYLLLILAIAIGLFSCKKTIQTEKEPNNDFFSANRIKPEIVEGRLISALDHDFFRIEITNPCVMDIELGPVKGINHAFKIWNESQTLLKYADDYRKSSSERMCNMFFNSGVYYIEVLHGDGDKPQGNAENYYRLSFNSRDWDEEEYEPDDNYENANLLELGREVKGWYSPALNKMNAASQFREEDWYYFDITLTDDNPMLLDVNLTGVPDVNSSLFMYDEARNVISSAKSESPGSGERLEGIGITKEGRYYIMVTSNFESNTNVPYLLQTRIRPYDLSLEIEPNNTFENANKVSQNEITGKINFEGDKDFYLYDIEKSDNDQNPVKKTQMLYKIEANGEGIDLAIKIYDENKKDLFEIDNIKGPGREIMPDAYIKNSFYIEVISKNKTAPGLEYKLKVTPFSYSENFEIEPNDTKETATKVLRNTVNGFISGKNDKDYFLLNFRSRVNKKFSLKSIKDSMLKISITDPLGYIIRTETAKENKPVSFSEMIDLKGYIIIESNTDNFEESYTIEIGD